MTIGSSGRSRAERIEHRAGFDEVRYANCWEDADVLVAALRPGPGQRILSIASAGDNALALAAEGADVVAADLSAAQLALVELKRAALGALDPPDALRFLGARRCDRRLARYAAVRDRLPASVRAHWDDRRGAIEGGVIHAGKLERYFAWFRERVLPLVHRRRTVRALLEPRTRAGRLAFHDRVWDNRRWRLLFRAFFSRPVLGRLGRDPEFFRYVDGAVAPRLLARTRRALVELPTHENCHLEYMLTGNYLRALPRYLRPEHADAVRAGLDRVTLVEGPIERAATGSFTGFNLSDLFEYLDDRLSAEVYAALIAAARPGARLAYWNLLVPRRRPETLAAGIETLAGEERALGAVDRGFFYDGLVLERVRPRGRTGAGAPAARADAAPDRR